MKSINNWTLALTLFIFTGCGGGGGGGSDNAAPSSSQTTSESDMTPSSQSTSEGPYLGADSVKVDIVSGYTMQTMSLDHQSPNSDMFMKSYPNDFFMVFNFNKDPGHIQAKIGSHDLSVVQHEKQVTVKFHKSDMEGNNKVELLNSSGKNILFGLKNDTTAPQLVEELKLENTQITAGEKIQFTLKIKEEESGLRTYMTEIDFDSRDGSGKKGSQWVNGYVRLETPVSMMGGFPDPSFNRPISLKIGSIDPDGTITLVGEYQTYPYDRAGVYAFKNLYLRDFAGNYINISDVHKSVTVTSVTPDTTAPKLQSIQFEKSPITLGEQIKFKVIVIESESGLQIRTVQNDYDSRDGSGKTGYQLAGYMVIRTPVANSSINLKIESVNADGTVTLSGEYQTYPYDRTDMYTLVQINLNDLAGNSLRIADSGAGNRAFTNFTKSTNSVAVNPIPNSNRQADTTPPQIVQGVQFEKRQITAGEKIKLTLKVKDSDSGLSTYRATNDYDSRDGSGKKGSTLARAYLGIKTPNAPSDYADQGINLKVESVDADGTVTLSGEYQTYPSDSPGVYSIMTLNISDFAGNTLSTNDLYRSSPTITVDSPF